MNKSETALELTLAMIEKGFYVPAVEGSNAALGKTIADLYNAILSNLSSEE